MTKLKYGAKNLIFIGFKSFKKLTPYFKLSKTIHW